MDFEDVHGRVDVSQYYWSLPRMFDHSFLTDEEKNT